MAAVTAKPPTFRVGKDPTRGQYQITEDGRPDFPARWESRTSAQAILNEARRRAEIVLRGGYFQTDFHYEIYVFIDRQKVTVLLPYALTDKIRRDAIRTEVMRHILDRVKGDEQP